jgi:hypothetical protein
MHGIDPSICMHHIYIQDGMKHVHQPQHRMNLVLKDIVKDELQKLLTTGLFIQFLIVSGFLHLCWFLRKEENGAFV